MNDSILTSIKKLLGIDADYIHFDTDIIIHINTAFATLNQLGIGPVDGFMIEGEDESWDDYITSNNLMMVKSYIFLKVRTLFDPPSNSALLESMKQTISELEFRLLLEGGDKDE